MSGETERNISAWTNDTVLVHLTQLVDERTEHLHDIIELNERHDRERFAEKDVRDQQRFDAQQLALRDALTSAEKAVNAALAAAQEAVAKAEGAAEKRFDAVNEFRSQLADIISTFMPRNETQVLLDGLNDKLTVLSNRFSETVDRHSFEAHVREDTAFRESTVRDFARAGGKETGGDLQRESTDREEVRRMRVATIVVALGSLAIATIAIIANHL